MRRPRPRRQIRGIRDLGEVTITGTWEPLPPPSRWYAVKLECIDGKATLRAEGKLIPLEQGDTLTLRCEVPIGSEASR